MAAPSSTISNSTELKTYLEQRRAGYHGKIGQFLLDTHLIGQEDLSHALEVKNQHPDRKLGEILVDEGALSEEHVNQAVNILLGVPHVSLKQFDLDPAALNTLSSTLTYRYQVLPLMLTGEILVLACARIPSAEAQTTLSFAAQRHIHFVLADEEEITEQLKTHYNSVTQSLEASQPQFDLVEDEVSAQSWREAEFLAKQAPIVKLVNSFMKDAIEKGASDVHIRPRQDSFDLLYRIDGSLICERQIQKTLLPAVVSRLKILSRLNIAEHRLPQDGHFRIANLQQMVDIRISIIPTQYGESVVLRILNKQRGLRKIEEIGFTPEDLAQFTDLIQRSNGIILVTGPTGSGKSTTLYAAMQSLRHESLNIITVEDPIEYDLPDARQIQLLEALDFGFPQTLRHILRHDPDVIMIGEMRDEETCKIALESALTGHLVLSTLHTNDAPSAIVRLEEMGMTPYLIKSALLGVVGQRLVRLNCPECMEEEKVSPVMRRNLNLSEEEVFYQSRGCPHCHDTGFQGRAAIYELFVITDAIREQIRAHITSGELRQIAIEHGMRTMMDHGLQFARARLASLSEVYRAAI